jgi:myo-inositol-1(or 4)-monophosphatase
LKNKPGKMDKKFVTNLAKKAGKIAMQGFHKKKKLSYKTGYEVVTQYDHKVEKMLVKEIRKKYPDHNILGEEFEYEKTDSKYTWVIDPIDGTANYARGIPIFSVSICLLEKNEPILNVTYDPTRDHMYYAKKGKGAFLNNKRLKVSTTDKTKDTIVSISSTSFKPKDLKMITKIKKNKIGIRIFYSTALSLCYVSHGIIDARIKTTVGKYDVAGGALMIREAGGIVTDFKGRRWSIDKHEQMLACNKRMYKKILSMVK